MQKIMAQFIDKWKNEKALFISVFVIGIVAHGYMMFNKFPNLDDYIACFHYGAGYEYGRWMLALMGNLSFRMDGCYSLPWLNGLIFLLFLDLSVIVFLKPFKIENLGIKIVLGGLFISFPTVIESFSYMFLTPFYGIAIFLMAVGFYLTVEYRFGFCVGILCICCSLGIYQGYYGLVAGFLLMYLMTLCMSKDSKVKEILILSGKSLIMLIFGIIGYLVTNKIMLKWQGMEISGYRGLDKMGVMSSELLLTALKNIYGKFGGFLFRDYLGCTPYGIIRFTIGAAYLVSLVVIIYAVIRNAKANIWKSIGLINISLLFPFAVNIIYLMCMFDQEGVTPLMCYSFVLVFFLPFILLNKILKNGEKQKICNLKKYTQIGLAVLTALTVILYVRLANIYYLALGMDYEEAYYHMLLLNTRIQTVEGYDSGMPVVYYGKIVDGEQRTRWDLRIVESMLGRYNYTNIMNVEPVRKNFMRIYFNESYGVGMVTDEDTVKEMPCYPDEGSVKVIGDTIVVKFSNEE